MTKLKTNFMQYITYILIFFFIYSPYIKISGVNINFPLFLTLILIASLLLRTIKDGLDISVFLLVFVYLIPFIYILFTTVINSTMDTQVIIDYILTMLSILAVKELVTLYQNHIGTESERFVKTLFIIGVVHAYIMVCVFFVPFLRDVLYSVVYINEVGAEFLDLNYRSPGLTTAGGDGLAFIQSVLLVFGILLFSNMKKRKSIISYLFYSSSFAILLFSIFISGRTGFVFLIFGLFLIFTFRSVPLLVISKKFTFRMSFLVLVLVTLLFLAFIVLSQSDYVKLFLRVFELFLSYFTTGEATTTSTNDLGTMFFLPQDEMHLLFGDGNFGRYNENRIIESDVGYVRFIFGSGILGTLLVYGSIMAISIILFSKTESYYGRFIVLFVSSSLFVMNVKVLHYFGSALVIKLFFLIFFFYMTRKLGSSEVYR